MSRSAQVVIIVLFMAGSVPGLKGSQWDEAEAHANRAPKEMFRGPSVLDVHEVFLSTDTTD